MGPMVHLVARTNLQRQIDQSVKAGTTLNVTSQHHHQYSANTITNTLSQHHDRYSL
jgi:hypothetical protein